MAGREDDVGDGAWRKRILRIYLGMEISGFVNGKIWIFMSSQWVVSMKWWLILKIYVGSGWTIKIFYRILHPDCMLVVSFHWKYFGKPIKVVDRSVDFKTKRSWHLKVVCIWTGNCGPSPNNQDSTESALDSTIAWRGKKCIINVPRTKVIQ